MHGRGRRPRNLRYILGYCRNRCSINKCININVDAICVTRYPLDRRAWLWYTIKRSRVEEPERLALPAGDCRHPRQTKRPVIVSRAVFVLQAQKPFKRDVQGGGDAGEIFHLRTACACFPFSYLRLWNVQMGGEFLLCHARLDTGGGNE